MNYIDNEEFIKSLESDRLSGMTSDKTGGMLLAIQEGLMRKYNFIGYTDNWKDEMRSIAMVRMVTAMKNFDTTKYKNPHAYFTMVCYNGFVEAIRRLKKSQVVAFSGAYVQGIDAEQDELTMSILHDQVMKNTIERVKKAKKVSKNININDII